MHWIDNPVYRRETAQFQRGKTQVFLLVGGPLVLGGIFLFHYLGLQLWRLHYPVGPLDSRPLFELQVLILFWMLVCLAPVLVGNSIHKDLRSGTLTFLRMTRMTAWEIPAGKCLAYLGFFSLIFLSILPILGMAFLLGGVSLSELVGAFVIIMTAAVHCSLFAMIAGLLMGRNISALVAGTLSILLYVALPLILPAGRYGHLVFPSLAILQILGSGAVPTASLGRVIIPFWVVTAGMGSLTGALLIALSGFLVRQEWWLRRSFRTVVRRTQSLARQFSADNLLDERKNPFLDWELKNLFVVRYQNLVWVLSLVAVCCVTVIFLIGSEDFFQAFAFHWLTLTALLVMLIPIFYASQTVTKEKEQGTYDSLVLTMLQPRQVIVSKIKAGLLAILPLQGVALVVIIYCHALPAFDIQHSFLVQANFIWWAYQFYRCMYYTILGMFFSLVCNNSLRALALTFMTDLLLKIPFQVFMGIFACCGAGLSIHLAGMGLYSVSPLVSLGVGYLQALLFHGIHAVYLGLIMRALYDRSINLMRFDAYRR